MNIIHRLSLIKTL